MADAELTPEGSSGWAARWQLSIEHIWALVAGSLPAIVSLSAIGAADLAYQVRVGTSMFTTQVLPRIDAFTFTVPGRAWLDQQWLAQLLLASIYRPLGWAGLRLLQAGLVAATFSFVYLACRQAGANPMRSALLSLGGFLVSVTGLALRPQLVGALLFGVSMWLISGRRRHPRRLRAMPIVVALWANTHGSFFLGPLIVGLAWLTDRTDGDPVEPTTLRVLCACLVATVITPFGPRVWTYAVGISTNPLISRLVTEWQTPNIRRWDDALFFVSVLAVGWLIATRRHPVAWMDLVWIGVFLVIALDATRNILWWGLALPAVVAAVMGPRGEARARSETRSWLNTGIVAAVLAMFGAFALVVLEGSSHLSPGLNSGEAPVAITRALEAATAPGARVFNAQPWGSWLELALPDRRVFIDSRIEVFPVSVWNDYLEVSSGHQGWDRILKRWNVDAVAAEWGPQGRLIPFLRRNPNWRLVYQDGDGLIFVRR